MSNKSTDQSSAPELTKFFVPEVGEVEAVDLADLEKQLKKMRTAQEEGDVNN